MVWAEDVDRDADEVKHHRRDVKHVVGPVAPSREKSVEVAEDLFGPEIHATFSGIAVGEFNDGDALRPEEEDEGDDAEGNGNAAIVQDAGDHVEIENGYEKK